MPDDTTEATPADIDEDDRQDVVVNPTPIAATAAVTDQGDQ